MMRPPLPQTTKPAVAATTVIRSLSVMVTDLFLSQSRLALPKMVMTYRSLTWTGIALPGNALAFCCQDNIRRTEVGHNIRVWKQFDSSNSIHSLNICGDTQEEPPQTECPPNIFTTRSPSAIAQHPEPLPSSMALPWPKRLDIQKRNLQISQKVPTWD